MSTPGAVRRAEIHSFPARYRKNEELTLPGQPIDGVPGKAIFRLFWPWVVRHGRLTKYAKLRKALIPLHFGNPKLHNKLLASQHPNVG